MQSKQRGSLKLGTGAAVALATVLAAGCGGGKSRVASADHTPPFAVDSGKLDGKPSGVILIVIDTLRADHLGCYGSDQGLSPNIDEFASRSHLFENAVATSSWTRPSIASMLTSRFPTSLGVLDKEDKLPKSAVTLPEVLQQQLGFQTLGVNTNGNTSKEMGFAQGFDRYVRPYLRRRYKGDFAIHVAEGVTQRSLEILDERDPTQPFFLFMLYVDPHDPYLTHPEFPDRPEPPGRFDGSRKELKRLDRKRLNADPDDYARIKYLYQGEVAYVDHWIGEFLRGLGERDLDDDLMVVLTSDHGEGLWAHGLRGHGNDLYEETVHVPLLVHLPGMTTTDATRISHVVSLVDLAPTILATYGAQKPKGFQGFDLMPLILGEERGPAFDYVYSEMDHRGRDFESIRRAEWKMIRNRKDVRADQDVGSEEFFNLSNDPDELQNLANEPESEVKDQLRTAVRAWGDAVVADRAESEQISTADLSKETRESLVALGYIDPGKPAQDAPLDRETSATAPVRLEPSEIKLSRLDFSKDESAFLQVLEGGTVAESGALQMDVGLSTVVILRRTPKHTRWSIEGVIEADELSSLPVIASVIVDGWEVAAIGVHEPGPFILEGPLESAIGPTALLSMRIVGPLQGASRASGETGFEPWLTIHRISLR